MHRDIKPGNIFVTTQARGEEVDGRTDIFSLGIVLYQMATGRPTFRGDTSATLIGAILHERSTKPSAVNPRIPGRWDRIILKALEKDRTPRYQSVQEPGLGVIARTSVKQYTEANRNIDQIGTDLKACGRTAVRECRLHECLVIW